VVNLECHSCGNTIESRGSFCPHCGKKIRGSKRIPFLIILALGSMTTFGLVLWNYFYPNDYQKMPKTTAVVDSTKVEEDKKETEKKTEEIKAEALPASEITEKVQKDVSQVIEESLQKVVTIYTEASQGSGFLINEKGDILTNAHVVEGSIYVTVQDSTNHEYSGTVIGYSNNTDVAVVRVPDLAGGNFLPMETTESASLGEEVLALGSPLGLRNTATLGHITGVDRSFYIGERAYENIYQMSAQIASGSSGGPLVSLKTEKVIAINSAKVMGEESIGFSIPIHSIYSLITDWITTPLSEQELNNLFYNDEGHLHYQEELENSDDWYFDGGNYSDENNSYYDIPDDWYNASEEEDSLYEEDGYEYEEETIDEEDTYEEEIYEEDNEYEEDWNEDSNSYEADENYENDDVYIEEELDEEYSDEEETEEFEEEGEGEIYSDGLEEEESY